MRLECIVLGGFDRNRADVVRIHVSFSASLANIEVSRSAGGKGPFAYESSDLDALRGFVCWLGAASSQSYHTQVFALESMQSPCHDRGFHHGHTWHS